MNEYVLMIAANGEMGITLTPPNEWNDSSSGRALAQYVRHDQIRIVGTLEMPDDMYYHRVFSFNDDYHLGWWTGTPLPRCRVTGELHHEYISWCWQCHRPGRIPS